MPDSINADQLPAGYDQYLAYLDGKWPTYNTVRARFPHARVVGLTVTGHTGAHGVAFPGADSEPGDLDPAGAVTWIRDKLAADPLSRPVIYASLGWMGRILDEMRPEFITRSQVRLLTAHYGRGRHICGPHSCGQLPVDADGTQWTDPYIVPGRNGQPDAVIDMSELAGDFFTAEITVPSWEARMLQALPTVQSGDSGEVVRTVQGLCVARGLGSLQVDGLFGPATGSAVRILQARAHIIADGIVGPNTWPVLLGVA